MQPALLTWGQIRLNVLTTSPGVPLDIVDEFINSRYSTILESSDWIGLKAHTTIQTTAAYQSGADTVTATAGATAIIGAGTAWTADQTGLEFYIPGDNVTYTVEWITPTLFALDRPYEGKGGAPIGTQIAGSPYVLMQDTYPMPIDCRSIVTVLDPRTSLPMRSFTKDGLDAAAGMRATIGYPASWAEYDDTPEGQPLNTGGPQPVLHQIQFFPPPLEARGFPLEYLKAAQGFDGQTLTASPLPFISPTVILAGVRADVALWQEKFAQAAGYQKLYEAELQKLIFVEHTQRRVKVAMRMQQRFTRHRLQRVNRGYPAHGWAQPGGPT
jgi:hypothetical protein